VCEKEREREEGGIGLGMVLHVVLPSLTKTCTFDGMQGL